jgi:ATP-dependent Clp protease ATP-binding subunit ClpA
MVTRLARDSREIFTTAEAEARVGRSPLVEAEHLLLAMSMAPETDAGRVLASVGLSHEAIQEALRREFESGLATAGVSASLDGLERSSPEPRRRVRLGASFKAALERSVRATAGAREIRPAHLLLGVLGAQVGTVPRALLFAGVEQAEVTRLTRQALAS